MLKKLFGWGRSDRTAEASEAARLGVDVEMGYCPRCGDEYRAGIRRCAACDVELIPGAEKLRELQQRAQKLASRTMTIGPGDELVAIRNGKLKDLKPLQVLLARETIPSRLTGEAGGCAKG